MKDTVRLAGSLLDLGREARDKVWRFGWFYFIGFMAVVAIGYVPAFHDADGNLFGLFKLDLYDERVRQLPSTDAQLQLAVHGKPEFRWLLAEHSAR